MKGFQVVLFEGADGHHTDEERAYATDAETIRKWWYPFRGQALRKARELRQDPGGVVEVRG